VQAARVESLLELTRGIYNAIKIIKAQDAKLQQKKNAEMDDSDEISTNYSSTSIPNTIV